VAFSPELGSAPVFSFFRIALYHPVHNLFRWYLGADTAMTSQFNRFFHRETVQDSGVADGKVIRQRGGFGVYAHIQIEVRALNRGQGTMVAWNAGLNIPAEFVPAVLQGIQDTMNTGVLAELELTDISVSVQDGCYHDIDSTADAFREAARTALVEAIRQAHPIVLEAISLVTVVVPLSLIQAVDAAVTSYGGQPKAIPSDSPSRTITASLPASNVGNLITELLRISDGRANISSRSDGFRPRPEPPDSEVFPVVQK